MLEPTSQYFNLGLINYSNCLISVTGAFVDPTFEVSIPDTWGIWIVLQLSD